MDTSGEPGASRSRRRWPVQEKLRIVMETLEPGVSVPVVARRHCVNANQLFIWRGQYRRGELGGISEGDRAVKLLPVQVEQALVPQPPSSPASEAIAAPAGCMEIQISGGHHVKVRGHIDAEVLRVLIRELLRPC